MKYLRVLTEVAGDVWAIHPDKGRAICEFLARKAMGSEEVSGEIEAKLHPATERKLARQEGGVRVLPVHGTIKQRADMLMNASGGTSTDRIGAELREAASDAGTKAIVLDISSPGGSVYGIEELSSVIAEVKAQKPVVAVANSFAASAAYWIGSQATEFVVAPGGDVGSIGVYVMHQDLSAALEKEGQKIQLISAGEYKTEANPFEPLSDEARAHLQQRVDDAYGKFLRAVASGRGVSVEHVAETYGKGRMVSAERALEIGMVDRIDTLSSTIKRLMGSKSTAVARRRLALMR